MIKKPSSPLPFYTVSEKEDGVVYENLICGDKTNMGYLFTEPSTPEYRPDEVKQDADYIAYACNEYPDAIDFIERLESITTDDKASKLIRDYLKSKKIWT